LYSSSKIFVDENVTRDLFLLLLVAAIRANLPGEARVVRPLELAAGLEGLAELALGKLLALDVIFLRIVDFSSDV
jgi:hypothetical protein